MPTVTGDNFYIDKHTLQFRTGESSIASIAYDKTQEGISISNAGTGSINIGDAGGDIFIGDGSIETDIVFEQNGSIRALANKTLKLGQSDSDVKVNAQNFIVSGDASFSGAMTINGNPVMTGASDLDTDTLQTVTDRGSSTTNAITISSNNLQLSDSHYVRFGNTNYRIQGSNGGGYLKLYAGGSEAIHIDSSRNVALGNTSAGAKFEVRTDNNTTNNVAIRGESSTGAYFRLYHGGAIDTEGNITAARFIQDTNVGNNFYAIQLSRSSVSDSNPDIYGSDNGLVLGANASEDVLKLDTGNTVLVRGGSDPDTNSYKADFAVGVGTNPQISWRNQQVQIGGTDMNWAGKVFHDGTFQMAGWSSHMKFYTQSSSSSAYDIYFSPWNGSSVSEAMRILGEGRVGIGTNNPSVLLDVYNTGGWGNIDIDGTSGGELRFQKAGSTYLAIYASDTSSTSSVIKATDHLHIYSNADSDGSHSIYLNDAGNVGIGTVSPAYKLDVVDSDGGTLARFKDSDSSHKGIIIQGDTNGGSITNNTAFTSEVIYLQNSANAMRFYTDGTEAVRIDSSQRVGIGTNSVNGFTHINGRMLVESPTVPSTLAISDSGDATKNLRLGYEPTWDVGSISASDFGAGWKNIVIAPIAGDVGIGTTNPQTKLTVGSDGNEDGIELREAGNLKFKVRPSSSHAYLSLYDSTVNEDIRLNTNGDSWIGGGSLAVGMTDPSTSRVRIKGGTSDASTNALQCIDSSSAQLFYVRNDGVVSVDHNYFYAAASAGAYVQHDLRVRGSLSNDGGALAINGDVNFDSNTLYVDSSNNRIGIGTTNPQEELDLRGDMRLDSAGNTDRSIYFRNQSSIAKVRSDAALQFDVGVSSSPTAAMYIEEDTRNVGIGTTGPSTPLHVKGNIRAEASSSTAFADFKSSQVYANSAYDIIVGTNNSLSFRTNDTRRMTILGDGNVGIGTTNPSAQLDVIYGSSKDGIFVKDEAGGAVTLLGADGSNNARARFYNGSHATAIELNANAGSATYFNAGNVGIGTTGPATTLDVDGLISSDQIRSKKYTSLSGSANDWFPIGSINEHQTGPVLFQVITAYHSNMSFIVAKGYGSSQEHSITLLSSIDSNNTSYANIKGVRVRQDGQVEIQLYWTSGPSVVVNVTARSTTDPVSLPSSLATSTSSENIIDTVTNEDGKLRSRKLITTSSNVQLSDNGISYLNGGNVGIGTTNPARNLTVASSSTNALIQLANSTTSSNADNGLEIFVSDNDAGIVNRENGYLRFDTNNLERIRIASDGSVGIGSTNPVQKLDVAGVIRSSVTSRIQADTYNNSANSANIIYRSSTSTIVGNNASALVILDGGNVGIGTTNPTAKLDVNGAFRSVGNAYLNSDVQVGGDQIIFTNDAASAYIQAADALYIESDYDNDDSNNKPIVFKCSASERMRIQGDGNVGIGITSPSQTLHVKGIGMIEDASSTSFGTLQFGTDTSRYVRGNSAEIQFGSTIQQLHFQKTNAAAQIASSAADGTDAIQLLARTVHTSANILEVINGNGTTPIFTIDYAGHVGIGTDSPDTLLHLEASDPVLKIRDSSTTTNSATLWLQESDTYGVKINYESNGGDRGRDFLTIDTLAASDSNNQAGNHDNAWGIDQDGYVMPHKGAVDGNLLKSYEWLLYGSQVSGSTPSFPQNGATAENARIYGNNPFGEPAILWHTPSQDAVDGGDGGWNSDTFIVDRGKTYRTSVWVKKETDTPADGNLYLGTSYVDNLNGTYNTNPYFLGGNTLSSFGESGQWYLFVGYIYDSGHTGVSSHPDGGIYDRNGRKLASANSFKFTDSGDPSDGLSSNFNTSRQRVYNYYDANTGSKTYWWGPRFEPLEASTPTLQQVLNSPTSDTGASFMGAVGVGTSTQSQTNEVKLHVYKNANRATTVVQNNNHVARLEAYGTATAIDTAASNGVFIRNNGSNRVHFDAGGNVGIGVDDPDTKLEVQNTVGAPMLHLRPNAASSALNPLILYRSQLDGSANYMLCEGTSTYFGTYNGGVPSDKSEMIRILPNSSDAPSLRIGDAGSAGANLQVGGNVYLSNNSASYINGGNVGIGTTNPQSYLDVKTQIRVRDSNSDDTHAFLDSNASEGRLRLNNGSNWGLIARGSANNPYLGAYYGGSLNIVGFSSSDAASVHHTLTKFDFANQRVGIGSTTPAHKLDVAGSIQAKDAGFLAGVGGDSDGFIFHDLYTAGGVHYGYKAFSNSTRLSTVTDGVERLTVDVNGKVGIGITNPAAKLHIDVTTEDNQPALRISKVSDQNENALEVHHGTTSSTRGIADFTNSAGSVLHLRGDRKVGIGTTSPAATLDILGDNNSNAFNIIQGGETAFRFSTYIEPTNTNTPVFRQGLYYNTIENATIAYCRGGSSVGGFLTFQTNNGTERMRLDTNGRLGIGVTSPTEKLHVEGKLRLGTTPVINSHDTITIDIDSNNNQSTNYFRVTKDGEATELMRVQEDGNVGIGTTNPHSLLEVSNNSDDATLIVSNKTNGANGAYLRLLEAGSAFDTYGYLGGYIQYDGNNNLINIGRHNVNGTTFSDDVPAISIKRSDGNVGIGITAPSSRLEVNGDVTITNKLIHAGDTDTFLEFTNNTITLDAGGEEHIKLEVGGVTINEGGQPNDFRIEGDTDTFLFFVDGSADKVGIGTSTPTALLDVDGTIKTKVHTIGALPSASPAGQRAMVSDSYYTFGSSSLGSTVYAGGSAVAPVYSDGSYWRYG
jgi:hypothetical protein